MAPTPSSNEDKNVALPNLHDKPSFEQLCGALEKLAIKPTDWSINEQSKPDPEEDKNINGYLLSIISNGLKWIKVDPSSDGEAADPKEVLWELASKRMAERCGRSAMPEMTRSWVIPASSSHPELKLEIREPPLTGDNLGLKTWGTAFVISKKLEYLGARYFSHLLSNTENVFTTDTGSTLTIPKLQMLELGSGTGLVGIAAAAIWKVPVVLTDLPEIQENLEFNVNQNSAIVKSYGGKVSCATLDWKHPEGAVQELEKTGFDVLIAADPLYDDEHPRLVANMVKKYLIYDQISRALIAIPMRDKGTKKLATKLIELLRLTGLHISAQGEELFKDDWTDANDEGVKCWWSIWCWNIPWTS